MHTFSSFGNDGSAPAGSLAIDTKGNLYGTTSQGTNKRNGSLWKLSSSGGFRTLHRFKGGKKGDGANPLGSLLADEQGNIYGTTDFGGAANAGSIFKYSPGTGYQLLVSMPGGAAGKYVAAGIARDPSDGTMYGVAQFGGDPVCNCGTVFKIDATTLDLNVIHTFVGTDGAWPVSTPLHSGAQLYGTTTGGKTDWFGTPYSINTSGSDFAIQTPTEGREFFSALAKDALGNLWGAAFGGTEAAPWGGIFKIDPLGNYSWQYSFQGTRDGAHPLGTPLIGSDGLIYGTTMEAGDGHCGTLYQFDPGSSTLKTLHAFTGHEGCSPTTGLIQDAAGVFYGVSEYGGDYGADTVFRLRP